ncbi:MAG: acyl-CoA thioesterase II [Propionibacteriales bacterium]|nr:acyl-CoA thioesterase II [Propionibacteriales bacterium]
MPQSVSELVDLLALEQIEVDLFRGQQPKTGLQRVFGGQVAAQALRAACHSVAGDRFVHSLHAYFLRGGDTSVPIVYDVERIRDGGSFSTRRVVARQHGRSIFYLTASFHLDEDGYDHQDTMPDVPAPDDCPTMSELYSKVTGRSAEAWEAEWAALDLRYIGDSRPGGSIDAGERPAQTRLWLRASGELSDDRVLNTCVLTYASDLTLLGTALVPHGVLVSSRSVQTASLDHAMWFHRPFRADEWLLYDQGSPSAAGARGLALGRLFSADGRLVASVAQEGLIRRISRPPADPTR